MRDIEGLGSNTPTVRTAISDTDFLYADLATLVVPGRECGTCTLCCKLIAVTELHKPRSTMCVHCIPEGGCGIHETRPHSCRGYFCNWLLLDGLGPEWKPEQCKFVLQSVGYSDGTQCLAVNVDPDFPDCWRVSPFYERIKRWAVKAADQVSGGIHYVIVLIDQQKIVILPDREIDLGVFTDDDQISIDRKISFKGVEFSFRKVSKNETGVECIFV